MHWMLGISLIIYFIFGVWVYFYYPLVALSPVSNPNGVHVLLVSHVLFDEANAEANAYINEPIGVTVITSV